jgi:AcrR family transcriptional regulator
MTIDHEKRRRDIASVAIELIAREGLGAATIRRIAAAAGCSTAAVTNYFADKDELLMWTFEVLSAEGEQRFAEALERDPQDAINALLTLVPWCPDNVRRWKAYLAFWDEAARNAYLASLLAQSTDTGFSFMQKLLRLSGAERGGIEQASQLLNALIQGMALQMLVDRQAWPLGRIRETLGEVFALALAKAGGDILAVKA